MKESRSETLWNKEIRRCCVVDIGDKARKAREGWYEQITKRKAAGQRHCGTEYGRIKKDIDGRVTDTRGLILSQFENRQILIQANKSVT